jgi:hypothetical protein
MLAAAGFVLWMLQNNTQSPRAMSIGVTVLVLGFAAGALCFAGWLLTDHPRTTSSR